MKANAKVILLACVVSVASVVVVCKAVGQTQGSQDATIVSVTKRTITTPPLGAERDAVRAPLQSHYFRTDISVQVKCTTYNARYDSELDFLPSELSPNNQVPIRVDKRTLYLDLPGTTLKTTLLSHTVSHEGNCE